MTDIHTATFLVAVFAVAGCCEAREPSGADAGDKCYDYPAREGQSCWFGQYSSAKPMDLVVEDHVAICRCRKGDK